MFGEAFYSLPDFEDIGPMLGFSEFMALYMASLAAAVIGGLTLARTPGCSRRAMSHAWRNLFFAIVIAVLPLTIVGMDFMDISVSNAAAKQIKYTDWFLHISGGSVSALQARLDYGLLIDMSILFYVWVFAFVTFFSPLYLLVKGDTRTFRSYSLAMAINYMIMIPFYIILPVSVTSSAPDSGVAPLLYVHPNWGRLVTDIDPLNNVFPSGHTSMIVTSLLIFGLAQGMYKRYSAFLAVGSAGTVLAVLVLGVHWPPDVLMGLGVAALAVFVARSERVVSALEKITLHGRKASDRPPSKPAPKPVPSYEFVSPMVYPKGSLTLSSYDHQFVVGRHERVPVSLIPGAIRIDQTLYIQNTNLRRAEADEVRQALPDGIRTD